ncbi:DUF5329 family protein [Leptospira meyeri]|uniref:DUF5329 family protein n=1 Tax=Leptospira meyeri TaxID=29508 RepID=UPI000C2B2DB2|nr:DUF5329 family protein [Leptospira meyeri]PKA25505.1 hypothetical protein CH381_15275 [Leptospira sp. mixed culture ATI2-C-A1]MCW7487947.1 DUF5329 domain-containing protein [Leptospira meyeri]PKA10826.1 hypothetical protein CH372_17405 [Leptospira meyeri]TGM19973.1 hypothetical protein EHQ73_17070 [Leptospira meyeri]TGM63635.1 hypothetical protein EHQ94_13360 [Leptospira meyeri]
MTLRGFICYFMAFVLLFLIEVSNVSGKSKVCLPLTEEEKIEKLLKKVGGLQGSFIRNGESHTAEEAEKHLRYKLKEAKNSFFAPDPKEWTAKLFIEKIASKSFLSGTPYQIKFADGKEIKSADWLSAELKKIESCL